MHFKMCRVSFLILICVIDAAISECITDRTEEGETAYPYNTFLRALRSLSSVHLKKKSLIFSSINIITAFCLIVLRIRQPFEMFQCDVKCRPAFRRAGRERRHDFPIGDREYSRPVVHQILQQPGLSEYTRLRCQGDFRSRVRQSEEAEKARPAVQLHHVGEGAVVRRPDVAGAAGSVVQSHRVDRAYGLRETAGPQMARRQGEPFDVPGPDSARTDGRPREAPFLRESPHLPVPRHGERAAHFFFVRENTVAT